MNKEKLFTFIYNSYVLIIVFVILGLYIGYVPVDLGNDFLKFKEGNLVPFNPEFIEWTKQASFVYVLFSTAISALGALVSIGTRNIFEVLALFWAGMLPKERSHWGIVFDQNTNQPISFVPVRLFRSHKEKKELLAQTVTDTDGRYRLHLNEPDDTNRYLVEVYYPGYQLVTQDVNQYLILGNYDLIHDIPLIKLASVVERIKILFYYYRPKVFKYLFLSIYYTYILLWVFEILLTINSPIFINFFSFGVMTITLIWNTKIIRSKLAPKIGKIIDAEAKKPISKAVVKIYTDEGKSISAITDDSGIVNLNIPSGIYKMLATAKGYLMLSQNSNGLKVVKISKDGFIDENILLKRDLAQEIGDSSKLLNPFE